VHWVDLPLVSDLTFPANVLLSQLVGRTMTKEAEGASPHAMTIAWFLARLPSSYRCSLISRQWNPKNTIAMKKTCAYRLRDTSASAWSWSDLKTCGQTDFKMTA